jgi:hypothetical protein
MYKLFEPFTIIGIEFQYYLENYYDDFPQLRINNNKFKKDLKPWGIVHILGLYKDVIKHHPKRNHLTKTKYLPIITSEILSDKLFKEDCNKNKKLYKYFTSINNLREPVDYEDTTEIYLSNGWEGEIIYKYIDNDSYIKTTVVYDYDMFDENC